MSNPATAQTAPVSYPALDARMQLAPDSSARSVGGLVRYIRASFTSDEERSGAAFAWVARHIRYAVPSEFSVEFDADPAEVVQRALSQRSGMSQEFAELYAALANALGLKTHVVHGFTRLANGRLSPLHHSWCVTRLGSQWYLMDPTHDAAQLGKFASVPPLGTTPFQSPPADFVRTRFPFDPLWQLLEAPYSLPDFEKQKVPVTPARTFAFADSLAAYERLSPEGQLRATRRRVQQQRMHHRLPELYLSATERLEYNYVAESHNRMLDSYNRAQQRTDRAVTQLNAFFDYYNHQFQPRKTDAQLQQLLPPIAADLQQARAILTTVQFTDEARQATVRQLAESVSSGEARLRKSQAFLKRYLATPMAQRPVLFTTRSGPNEMTR
ncbi:transglutaminase domain-containing protein [Hymenobacter koreensis]|uniref:Transglutaminase-like domain-containing protein n=1 Tax=Hymenobacter koreensis TaxID=1084523 RepID=A0ABP8JK61_9BACT